MHGPRFHLDHAFTRRHLSAHVDRDLAPADRRRVARHLADCEECGQAERSLRWLVRGLGSLGARRSGEIAGRAVERVSAAQRDDRRPR